MTANRNNTTIRAEITRVSRRSPSQERSRDTVDCILEAASRVFGKLGYAGTTTNKIAKRAGVSIGSLYQYFSSKDDILLVLLEKHQREARITIETARLLLSDPAIPLENGLRNLLKGLLSLHTADPALSRVLVQGIHKTGGDAASRKDEDEMYAEVVRTIMVNRPDVHVEHPGMAARVVVQTIEQLVRWLGHESDPSMDADAFIDEMLTMLMRYLRGTRREQS
jgi:AcrR family transcriptional regulator